VASVVIAAGTIALAQEFPGTTSDTSAVGASPGAGLSAGEATIRSLRREALVQHDLPIVAHADDTAAALPKPPLPVDGS
jgi:hypothetical protein